MAQQRRSQRDRFRGYDQPDDRQNWDYGRGRDFTRGMGRTESGDSGQSFYGYGREREYPEGYGRGGEYGRYAGERWGRGARNYASESYGPAERYDWDDEWSRARYGYRGAQGGGEERGMWDRATDEVSSWFGDEDAQRRRRMDQFRGRGPKNYTRSEDRIREDVCDRLTDDWSVDASEIDVNVSGSEVTLSGTVPNRAQRRRAEDCAEWVSGVTHVQNNLRVKDQTQEAFARST